MMRWKVMLPKEKSLWLESDTPHEALEKLGYDKYALMDVRIIPERELPRRINWIVETEPWPVKGSYSEKTIAFRCFAPGKHKGYHMGTTSCPMSRHRVLTYPQNRERQPGYAGQRRSGGRLCYNDGAQPEPAGPHTV